MPKPQKKNVQKVKRRENSSKTEAKDRSESKSKSKEISQGENSLLGILRKKQGPELKLPTDLRPDFKEPRNRGSSKGDDEKKKKESKGSKKVTVFSKKDNKVKIDDTAGEKSRQESKKSKPDTTRGRVAASKNKNEGLSEPREDSERTSEADTEKESDSSFHDDYLDVPDKQQKRDYSANEKTKFSKFDAQYELEKEPRRLKSVIREKYQQQQQSRGPARNNETLKVKDNEIIKTKKNKEKKPQYNENPQQKEKPAAPKESIYAESLYKASDVFIELEGVEIESEVEDYHAFRNEHKPEELVVELAEGAQGSAQRKKPSASKEKNPSASEEKKPSATKEKKPSASKEKKASASEEKKASASKEKKPSATKEKKPSASKEKKPSATKEKKPKEKPPKVARKGYYSLEEDLKLIEYANKANASLAVKPNSRKFWEDAIKDDNILEGARSSDSLRERYRLFLCDLDEAEKAEIAAWVSIHGNEGFLLFKKRELDGNEERSSARHRLDTIVLKYRPPTLKSPEKKVKKEKKEKQQKEKRVPKGQPQKQGPQKAQPKSKSKTRLEEEFENENFASENENKEKKTSAEPDSATQKNQKKKKGIVYEDIDDTRSDDNEISKKIEKYSQEYKQSQKIKESKRSEMLTEDDIEDEKGLEEEIQGSKPRKKVKKQANEDQNHPENLNQSTKQSQKINIQMNQRDMQKVTEKADWIKNLSKAYNKTPTEFLQIFFCCSMNLKLVEDYFNGDESVLWTKEEDEVLQQGRDHAIRILGKYKTPENVQIRQEFLNNFHHLEKMLGSEHYLLH